jgi:predicted nuclease with TOPRIM domain
VEIPRFVPEVNHETPLWKVRAENERLTVKLRELEADVAAAKKETRQLREREWWLEQRIVDLEHEALALKSRVRELEQDVAYAASP